MKQWFIPGVLLIGLFAFSCKAISSDAAPASQITVQGHKLNLNGSGERSKFFTQVYVAYLYVSNTSDNAESIISADAPQLMRLKITSSMITAGLLNSSIKDGLKLSAGDDYAKYAAMLDEVMTKQDVPVNIDDQFDFLYEPGKGVRIFRNSEELGAVPGYQFKQILFGIWLGDSPIQGDLKEDLLEVQ